MENGKVKKWVNTEYVEELKQTDPGFMRISKLGREGDYHNYKILNNTIFELYDGELVNPKTNAIMAVGKQGASPKKIVSEALEVYGQNQMFAKRLYLDINGYHMVIGKKSDSYSVIRDYKLQVAKRTSRNLSEIDENQYQ